MEQENEEAYLLGPYAYINKLPGKQVRSRLATAFNFWLEIDQTELVRIMATIDMLHNASLMIDDIEDDSILRRGLPVTHSIYGVARTINSANYIYFAALSNCIWMKPNATEIFVHQMMELHRGQGKELCWRDTVHCPSEKEYEEMVKEKTGGLFVLAVHLMQLYSSKKFNFKPLIDNLALYFQIRDDYINLQSEHYATQKTFAEDITEGKFSFPIIAAIQHGGGGGNDDEVLNILRQRTTNIDVKKYCVKVIKERDAFSYTLKRLKHLYKLLMMHIAKLGGNAQLEALIKSLNADISNKNDCE